MDKDVRIGLRPGQSKRYSETTRNRSEAQLKWSARSCDLY